MNNNKLPSVIDNKSTLNDSVVWMNPSETLDCVQKKIIHLFWLAILVYSYSSVSIAAENTCKTCHVAVTQQHHATPHGQADVTCDGCHGDGKLHMAAPSSNNIPTFYKQPAADKSGTCVGCHNNNHANLSNAHTAAGITCASCHSIHLKTSTSNQDSQLPLEYQQLTPESGMCFECHQDSFTQFKFNERHRLEEGVVTCTSCHDPHSPKLGMELGGFNQSICRDCHADVEGPFVFEHVASRVEGCAACHEPHGSPNRHMLKIQDVGALCYSCHADAPQFHLGFSQSAPPRFDESTVCTNCHVTIHGSNLDAGFLR